MSRRDEAKPLPYLAAVLVADAEETKRAIEEAAGELRAVLSKWNDGVATDALGRVLGETVRRRGDFDDIWVHPEGDVYARPVKGEQRAASGEQRAPEEPEGMQAQYPSRDPQESGWLLRVIERGPLLRFAVELPGVSSFGVSLDEGDVQRLGWMMESFRRGVEPAGNASPTAAELNQRLGDIDGDGLPFFCEACGASRSIVPVTGVPTVRGECRECHELVPGKAGK